MTVDLEKWKTNWFKNEMQFQQFCILMISQLFPRLRDKVWHTPNENYIAKKDGETEKQYKLRASIEGNRFKGLGVLSGVMDILIVHNGILYKIELKQPGGSLSKSQQSLHMIWSRDCPQIPILVAYYPIQVYEYCKWILEKNYKINFI